MTDKINKYYLVESNQTIKEALIQIETNKSGFVIIMRDDKVLGTLTDGDIRRALINSTNLDEKIDKITFNEFSFITIEDSLELIIDRFKSEKYSFLPIVTKDMNLINIITRKNLHALLMLDIAYSPLYPFDTLNDLIIDFEVYGRPWGFYKTMFMNEFSQAKLIKVNPHSRLSLQKHKKREEYWVIIYGEGTVQIDESLKTVKAGDTLFIPRGSLHRVENPTDNSLFISEIQLGTYFGEDDIIRFEDDYSRI